jgi:hypothetical protein
MRTILASGAGRRAGAANIPSRASVGFNEVPVAGEASAGLRTKYELLRPVRGIIVLPLR